MSTAAPYGLRTAPLAVAQEALWYRNRLSPGHINHNEAISIRRDGPLDLPALRRAFNEVVRRHEAWRTVFDIVDGAPVQIVRPPARFELPVIDLSALEPEEAEREAVRLVAEVARVPYDIRRGPLLRPRLVRFPAEQHRLYLAMHHLIFDGVSVYRVVLRELVALYDAFRAGEGSPLPEPETRYADYARWEQDWITGPRAGRRLEYWRRRLAGSPALELRTDRPRAPAPRFRGAVVPLSVPRETLERLRVSCQAAGATQFQGLASAWALLLSRFAGQREVVFATAADLRQRPEFEAVVGYSLTPLALRVDLSGDPSLREVIVRVRNELLDGLQNLMPFERLVRELGLTAPEPGANPLYGTMVGLEPAIAGTGPGWSIHQMESGISDAVATTKLDLELELDERPEGHIAGRLIYDRDLFEAGTVGRLVAHWLGLVQALGDDPEARASDLPVISEAERRRQLIEWNATDTRSGAAGQTVGALLRARAVEDGDAPAVEVADHRFSRAELDRAAAAFAARLVAAGVGPRDVVALCGEPSPQLIASALGALQAGAAHLLLDPRLPAVELDGVLDAAGASALVAEPGAANLVGSTILRLELGAEPGGAPSPEPAGASQAPCYVAPRGTAVSHDAVVNQAGALADGLGVSSADTLLVLRSMLFAAPSIAVWAPLLTGARIVLAPAGLEHNGAELNRLIAATGATLIPATPTQWRGLIESGLKATRGVRALSCGEPLPAELKEQILKRCGLLWNGFATAETAGCATLARMLPGQPVTIGRPLANTRAYVVDRQLRPVPVGVVGELIVAGAGVALGRAGDAAPDGRSLIDDPFGPGRAVRTGDRVRWRTSGELEWVAGSAAEPV